MRQRGYLREITGEDGVVYRWDFTTNTLTERLRLTPTGHHDDALTDALITALVAVWEKLDLPRETKAKNASVAFEAQCAEGGQESYA